MAPNSNNNLNESVNLAPTASSRNRYDPRYWVIHGKHYDFSEFAKVHPGGEYILMVGKGRDCTEIFESVHSLIPGGANRPLEMMKKYEVKDIPQKEELFSWAEDGFYNTLRERVRLHFEGKNYKASWFVYFKILIMFVLYISCWLKAATTGNWIWAVGSGALTEMIGFCLMHDSSHNAVSKKPWINYLGTFWSSWMFWNNWMWIQHHSYGHHSHTSIYSKDPDVLNAEKFVKKHPKCKTISLSKYQHYYSFILYTLLPNQHVGQIILYQLVPKITNNRLFGLAIFSGPPMMEFQSRCVMLFSFLWHFILPLNYISISNMLLIVFVNYTLMGISYFLNVAPNHDTLSTYLNHPKPGVKVDWGEHQVRTTGNHSISNSPLDRVISHLWGGMNYQIEHHLFPTLNHTHYHEVSLIVQKTCEDFGIKYNSEKSWFHAMRQFYYFLQSMGSENNSLKHTVKSD